MIMMMMMMLLLLMLMTMTMLMMVTMMMMTMMMMMMRTTTTTMMMMMMIVVVVVMKVSNSVPADARLYRVFPRNSQTTRRHETLGLSCPVRCTYVVGSKSFRPDIQKPRQMENAVRDI